MNESNAIWGASAVILYLALLVLLVLASARLISSSGDRSAEEKEDLEEQIRSLFVQGNRLTGINVKDLLKERTQGRLDIPVVEIFEKLDALVGRKQLQSDPPSIEPYSGFIAGSIEYFLPE